MLVGLITRLMNQASTQRMMSSLPEKMKLCAVLWKRSLSHDSPRTVTMTCNYMWKCRISWKNPFRFFYDLNKYTSFINRNTCSVLLERVCLLRKAQLHFHKKCYRFVKRKGDALCIQLCCKEGRKRTNHSAIGSHSYHRVPVSISSRKQHYIYQTTSVT